MSQLGLFDLLHAPPVIVAIKPNGTVVREDPHETLVLPHPRMAWERARIELHRHENSLWMWSTSWQCDDSGRGYRVGEKWGKFAHSRHDALFYAVREITSGLEGHDGPEAKQILSWLASL